MTNNQAITPPKLTIIILTYNQSNTIERTINSVINRCRGIDFEIIIGDDASTDSTRCICEKLAAEHSEIRLMPKAQNKGLVNNYFDCLHAARGKYIGDCAGDDIWVNEASITDVITLLESNPQVSVVFSDTETMCEETNEITPINSQFKANTIIKGEEILKLNLNHINALPYVLSAAIYRKSALVAAMTSKVDIVRIPEFGIEDLPIIAALASQGDAIRLPGVALRYFIHNNSVSNNNDAAHQAHFYIKSLELTRRLCEHYNVPQEEVYPMFKAKAKYIAGMTYKTRNRQLLQRTIQTLKKWHLPWPLSTRLRLLVLYFTAR